MPFDTRTILLERFLARRTRQRAASVARAKESLRGATRVDMPVQVVVPAALRKYNEASVRRFIASGKLRGYVTFEEANDILPESEISTDDIAALLEAIDGLGFELSEC